MTGFSYHAHKKMIDLFHNHSHEVGSQYFPRPPGKTPTDCITYVINVLTYAFEQTGKKTAADRGRSLGEYGTELAKYLVDEHKWIGNYYNKDVNHPSDGDYEHTYSFYKRVLTGNKYYGISISNHVINYAPTPKNNSNYTSFPRIGGSKEQTKLNLKNLEKIKKVKFAFGLSRGGKHTWLFSEGKVYEVHWERIGSGLYEATKLEDFQWLSGAIIVPPDAYTAADFDQRDFWDDVSKFLKGIFD
ncbi:hypothetical protein [uncultured Roseibium sp.]|uniref:hypothetical protein n=1 Tax=uncultured Roseibium sp. TaxID=1936171 RepID=UPI0026226F4D|nr:hypothetical protein [uncultured Roseibium sp.]